MGKWREEEKILPCGCKLGRSGKGPWFFDFYCDKHVEEVRTDGRFDYEKSLALLEKTNRELKENERSKKNT